MKQIMFLIKMFPKFFDVILDLNLFFLKCRSIVNVSYEEMFFLNFSAVDVFSTI